MGTMNLKKLALVTVVSVGGLAIAACGSSPMGPSDIGSTAALSAATTSGAGSANTSGKPGIRPAPIPSCAFGKDLSLRLRPTSGRQKGVVEIASNYDLAQRGCKGLAWSVFPAVPFEPFTAKVDSLRVYPHVNQFGDQDPYMTVEATSPDGQVAKLRFVPPAVR